MKRLLRAGARRLALQLKRLAAPEDFAPPVASGGGSTFDRTEFANEGVGRDGFPIPPRWLWRSSATSFEAFTEFGQETFARMRGLLSDAGFAVSTNSRILDFGSGSGRFVRMWGDEAGEVWGCDLNADQIRWCQTFLTPPYRFVTTGLVPSLPFEDATFDLIYAGSVFTHIPAGADTWLLELRRILRPGGYLFVTIHDEQTWEIMKGGGADALEPFVGLHPAGEAGELPADFVVLGEGPASNVFYRRGYFESLAAANFDVRSATGEARGYQTAFVLQRPTH